MTYAPAALAAVDVAPDGERIEGYVGEHRGGGGAMQVQHRRQVVVVAPARLGAGTLEPLPVLVGAGNVGEVGDMELRGFLIHAIEDVMSAVSCRTNFPVSGASPYGKEMCVIASAKA
ncbi:hypothetical protein AN480_09170 [Mycobacterium intracellulare subsp. chimaera]|nr:hypothetical protein AN480_09170 [Mycobacterium intracellulare subsp. chimaera]KPN45004.1 hypothetical protein AN933_29475 [Mycobacterium intracellulare subsp. chimaera]KPN46023.1 hypothetical protein AN932_24885 [Mycobacterium intracellulare subsp. chimaera]ORV19457.1 hypothetical protein AWB97_25550 [Mycobacterium intracellulare subsp. chimaera]